MKPFTSIPSPRQASQGSVLIVSLVIIAIVGLALLSSLALMQTQMKLSGRSQCWNSCVPVAEAGIEEALAHLTYSAGNGIASNGWTLTGSAGYQKQLWIIPNNAYYVASISTNSPRVIQAEGFVRNPGTTQYISRKIEVLTTNSSGTWKGLVVKDRITAVNTPSVDSYNSTTSGITTNGGYATAKALDHGFLGTISTTNGALGFNGKIKGSVGVSTTNALALTSPGVVGDSNFVAVAANAGKVQSGHLNSSLTQTFTPNSVPFTNGFFGPGAGAYGGTNYTYLLNGGKFQATTMSGSNMKIMVSADSTLYVTDKMWLQGSSVLMVASGVKLKLYVGNWFQVTADSKVNPNGTTSQVEYYGLPTNTYIELEDNAVFVGTMNAPNANCHLEDSGQIFGAALFGSADFYDSFKFHYDESLGGGTGNAIEVISWSEL